MTAVDLPISVIISSFQEGRRLRETVMSVLASRPRPSQIVIVDDGSTDASCDGPWPSRVIVLHREHRGIAPARNAGAEAAIRPILVFLDAHCRVEPDWLDPIHAVLLERPDALVGATVVDADDSRCRGCGATLVSPLLEYRWNVPARIGAVQIVPGGCLAVSRTTFLESGGFGPFFGFGFEDVDLSLRWHGAGRPVLAVPASAVAHEFRERAPYPWEREHYVGNLLKAAIRNLHGERLRQTIFSAAGLPRFAIGVADLILDADSAPLSKHYATIERSLAGSEAWSAR